MILYIQFECDDDIHKQVEETIDFYAGGIMDIIMLLDLMIVEITQLV